MGLPGRDPGDPADRALPVRIGIRERVAGFRRALAAVPDAGLVVVDASDNAMDEGTGGRAQPARPAGRRHGPTAVFAVTDVLALGVLEAARPARAGGAR